MKIYHNPKCSKSRETLKLLEEKGYTPEIVLYMEKGVNKNELKEILGALKISAREILRTKEDEYKELGLNDKSLSEEKLIDAIVKHPRLLERPILVNGKKAALGRPPENVLKIL